MLYMYIKAYNNASINPSHKWRWVVEFKITE